MRHAESAGVEEITHIAEAHTHNDYVSGRLMLARITGANYTNAAGAALHFDPAAMSDRDRLRVGQITVATEPSDEPTGVNGLFTNSPCRRLAQHMETSTGDRRWSAARRAHGMLPGS